MSENKKIAIIGGSGKMGQWFARFLSREGKKIVITGRNEKKLIEAGKKLEVDVATNVEAVKNAEVVLLAVSIDSFTEVVQQISPYTYPEQVIVDIASIKVSPLATMHQFIKKGLVLGTHPVFGPGAKSLSRQNFVLTPTNGEEKILAEKVKGYLMTRGAEVTLMTPQEHDEMMAVILGLSHFIAIVSADTLLSFDKLVQMKKVGGITYKTLLTLVESVLSEDPELYAYLQMNLPNMSRVEELFQKMGKTWGDLVKHRDREAFVARMSALRNRLEEGNPEFGEAYDNMYRLADR